MAWWEAMWTDPTDLRTAFADGSPRELDDFLALLQDTARPFWLCLKDQEPLAAFWLHDLLYDETGSLCGGWLGGHIIQAARQPYGWALSEVLLQTLGTAGLAHVFAAVNVTSFQEQDWGLQVNVEAGVRLRPRNSPRGVRLALGYFRGPSALTQFLEENEEHWNFGIALPF